MNRAKDKTEVWQATSTTITRILHKTEGVDLQKPELPSGSGLLWDVFFPRTTQELVDGG